MLQLAVASDREAVNALARQVHELHVTWRPDCFEMAEELYPQSRFDAAVGNRELYVAKVGGQIVGYALLPIRVYNQPGEVKRKVLSVQEICVHEAARGHGIGTQMMMEIRVLARAFGCREVQLSVDPMNDGAVAFYQKCGFSIKSIQMRAKI